MRQQNKRLTPFGAGKQGADRPGHDTEGAGGGSGDQPTVSELHFERDAVREAVHRGHRAGAGAGPEAGREDHGADGKGGDRVQETCITLEEAARFEGVEYEAIKKRVQRNPTRYKTRTEAREAAGRSLCSCPRRA